MAVSKAFSLFGAALGIKADLLVLACSAGHHDDESSVCSFCCFRATVSVIFAQSEDFVMLGRAGEAGEGVHIHIARANAET
jgi:hypothetical protein